MQILNLACNGHRPGPPFLNIDVLRSQLKPGTPERTNLDAETNYLDHDLLQGIPFASETIDGVFCSHFVEHLDAMESVRFLTECRRVLKPGGLIVVSVPDAEYFYEVHPSDTAQNAQELFGEGIYDWVADGKVVGGPFTSFFDYALFFYEHKQLLTLPALWCLLVKAGFRVLAESRPRRRHCPRGGLSDAQKPVYDVMAPELNRRKFSLVMWAEK